MEGNKAETGLQGNGGFHADSAADALAAARDRLGTLVEETADFIQRRPGTALAIALGAGFVVGRMLRR